MRGIGSRADALVCAAQMRVRMHAFMPLHNECMPACKLYKLYLKMKSCNVAAVAPIEVFSMRCDLSAVLAGCNQVCE